MVDLTAIAASASCTAALGLGAFIYRWRESHVKLSTKFDDHVKEDEKQFDKVDKRFTEVIDRIGQSEQRIIDALLKNKAP